MKTILLTGSGGPAGINVAKSLKEGYKNDINLIGTDINKYHIKLLDGITNKNYIIPKYDHPRYLDHIIDIIKDNDVDFIHSQPDVEVRVLSEQRHRIPTECKLFLPSKETVRKCQDKKRTSHIWERNGFPSSESIAIRYDHTEEDIKHAFSKFGDMIWIRATVGAGGAGSTLAKNLATGVNWVNYWKSRDKNWEFIAQPYLDGKIYAFQSIWKDGKLITSQARERIEYIYPYLAPSGVTGTPVVAKTVHNDDINKCATEAVLAIDKNATGVFCVDIRNISTNNYKNELLMKHLYDNTYVTRLDRKKITIPMPTEINVGRFFTTSYFFTFAGYKYGIPYANMPWLASKIAFGEKIPYNIPKYNIIPKDLYWIRHIDCGQKLVKEKDLYNDDPFNF